MVQHKERQGMPLFGQIDLLAPVVHGDALEVGVPRRDAAHRHFEDG